MIDFERLRRVYKTARDDLQAASQPAGYWVGELSSSALSTATATSALCVAQKGQPERTGKLRPLISGGIEYLAGSQNDDGGWGDTDKSLSNISTTMLARAAFHLAGSADDHKPQLKRAEGYIELQGGISGLRKRYGRDKTFVVPILTNCALAGIVPWGEVSPLPYELACLPQQMYRFLRMPVVSYAIPALVAIGQARYFHRKPRNPFALLVRKLSVVPSLRAAQRMQPASGGYLEATPLTSFVVMSLAGTGRVAHPVVQNGVRFLIDSVRDDGSWPIDTNLATWVTTLSIKALSVDGEGVAAPACLDWLLSCQHQRPHPFTGAAPGGWGWTNLSGGVPDADDTSGALLALAAFRKNVPEENRVRIDDAAREGVRWLLNLQNSDGGWPTFCRGWGKLPFDRSGVDLTAHAIRAMAVWRDVLQTPMDKCIERGLAFLKRHQRPDGSWVPLWFGNQHQQDEENPVYGTAHVLLAYRDLGLRDSEPARQAVAWLAGSQNPDGGWGGDPAAPGSDGKTTSGVEETALAMQALLSADLRGLQQQVLSRGINWLTESVESGRYRQSSPIGFYFAKLWYYERLYPVIFTVAALGQALRQLRFDPEPQTSPSPQL